MTREQRREIASREIRAKLMRVVPEFLEAIKREARETLAGHRSSGEGRGKILTRDGPRERRARPARILLRIHQEFGKSIEWLLIGEG